MLDKRFNDASHMQTSEITLDLLDAIEGGESVSQRGLAARLGVALGLTNTLVKRCVRKGLLKVQTVPSNRYAYFLTPKGILEKGRLTAEYLSTSLNFFRDARSQCDTLFDNCEDVGALRVVLLGASDLAEIAILSALDRDIEIVGIVDEKSNYERLAGIPVTRSVEDIDSFDRIMITGLTDSQNTYDTLRKTYSKESILALPISRLSATRNQTRGRAGWKR